MLTTASYPWMTREYIADTARAEAEHDRDDHRIRTQPIDPETSQRTVDMRDVRPEID